MCMIGFEDALPSSLFYLWGKIFPAPNGIIIQPVSYLESAILKVHSCTLMDEYTSSGLR